MLKQLIAIAKAKFHFNVTCKLEERAARKRLEAYVATLSPEKQEWARNLRKSLDTAAPDRAAAILRQETTRLNEQHMRVTEKIDGIDRQIKSL